MVLNLWQFTYVFVRKMQNILLVFVVTFVAIFNFTCGAPHVDKERIRYDNYRVYKLEIKNKSQLAVVQLLANRTDNYNIWKEYDEVSKSVHIMVNPKEFHIFSNLMKRFNLKSELLVANVQKLIDEEQNYDKSLRVDSFGWSRYYELQEIEAWLDKVLAEHPETTEGFTIGQSYEGRTIQGIKISYKSGNPGIFIESNIHAREWITSATATWFINQLLTSQDVQIRNLAENYDWYIIPVFNVDGFVYSHNKDRMWRKTRQPVTTSNCIGTDANRNFDSHWMANNGASSEPCSETFAGPEAFSEPEVLALVNYLTSIKDKLNIYISFHSYGQYLLSPYSHTKEEVPENYDDLLDIGASFAGAIGGLDYKTVYTYGSTAAVLYVASGISIDWVYNKLDVPISYTIEFRDKGKFGFILPPVQIIPNCEELMAGMLALVDKSKTLGYV